MMRRFMVPSLAATLVLGTAVAPAAGQSTESDFTLTVLHSNDGESAMLPDAYEFTGDEDLVDFACPDGAPAPGFQDVPASSTHAAAIACGVAYEVIEGRSATRFAPLMDVTRGQMASLLVRLLTEAGVELPAASAGPSFSDLDPTHGDNTRRLAAADIIRGYEDGTFKPFDPIRRDQLASVLIRSLALVRGEAITPSEDAENFDDVTGGVHADNIAAAAELLLLRGKADGSFDPSDPTRRDQAATVVMRLLGRIIGEDGQGGAARFVDFVKSLQEQATGEDAGVVTISSGDNFLAGPEYTASTDSYAAGGDFYDALIYLEAGYDAMTIGNHEFDFGPAGLADFIEATDPLTFLSANLDFSAEDVLQDLVDEGRIAKSTVVEVQGREVGVIGATTEALATISSPGGVVAEAVLPAVEAEVDALTADGVDIILLSSHLQDLDNERDIIGELSGIDAVVGGGGAEDLRDNYPLFEEDADGNAVPLVTTPGSYRDVGKLVLEFDADGDLIGVGDDSGLLAVPPFGPKDATIFANVEVPVSEAIAELAETIVAENTVPLDARVASVRTRETNLANLMTDGLLRAARDRADEFGVPEADVALQNGGGIRGDRIMTPGELSVLDTFTTAPFGNVVAVDTVTAAELRAIMEHGLAGLPAVAGQFGHWAGVEFTYDASLAAGSRIIDAEVTRADGSTFDLVVAGTTNPAAPDDITIAGLNFTLNGGDAYPFDGSFTTLGITDQQALRAHLDAIGDVTADNYPDLTVDEDRYNRYGPPGGPFLP